MSQIVNLCTIEESLEKRSERILEDFRLLEKDVHLAILQAAQYAMELDPTIQSVGLGLVEDEDEDIAVPASWACRNDEELLNFVDEPETEEEETLAHLQDVLENLYSLLLTEVEISITRETTLEELEAAFQYEEEGENEE